MKISTKINSLTANKWHKELIQYTDCQKQLIRKINSHPNCSAKAKISLLKGIKETLKIKCNQVAEEAKNLESKRSKDQNVISLVSEKSHLVISNKCLKQVDKVRMNLLMKMQELIAKKNSIKIQKKAQLKSKCIQSCKSKLFQSILIPNAKMISSIIIEPQTNQQKDHQQAEVGKNLKRQKASNIKHSQMYKSQICSTLHQILKDAHTIFSSNKYLIETLKSGCQNQIEWNMWMRQVKLATLALSVQERVKQIPMISDSEQQKLKQRDHSQTTGSPNERSDPKEQFTDDHSRSNQHLQSRQFERQISNHSETKIHSRDLSNKSKYSIKYQNDSSDKFFNQDGWQTVKSLNRARIFDNSVRQIEDSQSQSNLQSSRYSNVLKSSLFSNEFSQFDNESERNQDSKSYLNEAFCIEGDKSCKFDNSQSLMNEKKQESEKIINAMYSQKNFKQNFSNKTNSRTVLDNCHILKDEDLSNIKFEFQNFSQMQSDQPEQQYQQKSSRKFSKITRNIFSNEQASSKRINNIYSEENKENQSISLNNANYQVSNQSQKEKNHFQSIGGKMQPSLAENKMIEQNKKNQLKPFLEKSQSNHNPFSSINQKNSSKPNIFSKAQSAHNPYNPFSSLYSSSSKDLSPFSAKKCIGNNPFATMKNSTEVRNPFPSNTPQTFMNQSSNPFAALENSRTSNPFSPQANQQSNMFRKQKHIHESKIMNRNQIEEEVFY